MAAKWIVFLGLVIATWSVHASSNVVLGLLYVSDANREEHSRALLALETKFVKHKCSLVRDGRVMGSKGPLITEAYNTFFVFRCKKGSPLTTSAVEHFLKLPSQENQRIVLLAGRADNPKFKNGADVKKRLFIIKLGRYNNHVPLTRDRQLGEINEMADTRSPTFRNEAFFYVDTAFGMERPDEVTILYYDDPASAQKFQSENGDVLKRIGKFNEDHLTSFSYLDAVLDP